MRAYETIKLEATRAGVAVVSLDRPEKHNAFNAQVVAELADAFENLRAETHLRMVILRGNGKSFSAG
ncbi:MAG: enoyl-CoA hydratase-related protein, partial [Pseudomonadota bacterium]